jgi:hypothetical protein
MADLNARLPMSSVMKDVVLHVDMTGVTTWRIRVWLGTKLIVLAARVMGCGMCFQGRSQTSASPSERL